MIFNATIQGTPEEIIACRVFDPSQGKWWSGVAWDVEAHAALTVIPAVGSSRHAGPVQYPAPGVVIEYLIDGVLEGEDPIPVPPPTVALSPEDKEELAAAIAVEVNQNLPSPVVIPLVDGVPTSINLTVEKHLNLKQGSTYRLTFSLGLDCTGWEAWFGGKAEMSQDAYDMVLRQAVYTDQQGGAGYIDLTQTDTAKIGVIHAELQLRKGNERYPPEQYEIKIVRSVIR